MAPGEMLVVVVVEFRAFFMMTVAQYVIRRPEIWYGGSLGDSEWVLTCTTPGPLSKGL